MNVPESWRTNGQRYRLEAEVCRNCDGANFPPRPVCRYCNQEVNQLPKMELVQSERVGRYFFPRKAAERAKQPRIEVENMAAD